jgi:hypothetical protein
VANWQVLALLGVLALLFYGITMTLREVLQDAISLIAEAHTDLSQEASERRAA